jgi:hypothetical protein
MIRAITGSIQQSAAKKNRQAQTLMPADSVCAWLTLPLELTSSPP